MSSGDTSKSESAKSDEPDRSVVQALDHLAFQVATAGGPVDEVARKAGLLELLSRPRTRLEALSFDDDPLEGVDKTATGISFGRVGDAPGEPRMKFRLRAIAALIYGHTPHFAQVHSEPAPAPEGADDTAFDEEWDARVVP